jgi:hypothetical protein
MLFGVYQHAGFADHETARNGGSGAGASMARGRAQIVTWRHMALPECCPPLGRKAGQALGWP